MNPPGGPLTTAEIAVLAVGGGICFVLAIYILVMSIYNVVQALRGRGM